MSAIGLVRRLGLAWVRVYTSGLPDDVRERRLGEIESDLFEQARAELIAGRGADGIAAPVASRFARGVASDVTWRIGTELETQDERDLSASWPGRVALVLILSIATTSLVYAILHAFGFFGEHRLYAFIQLALMVGSLVMLGGFSTSRRAPLVGGLQIAVPGLIMTVLWSFMLPIAVALLAVTGYGVYRAFRFSRENRVRDGAHTSRGTPA